MKTEIKITHITHDDLVNLFSTGLYGSAIFVAGYDKEFYEKYCVHDVEDCLDDKIAKVLLKSGEVYLFDEYAEDEDEFYGKLPHKWNEEDLDMCYTIKINDVVRGIELALNGDSYAQECALNLSNDEGCNLDLPQAESLLQYICFGEILYD